MWSVEGGWRVLKVAELGRPLVEMVVVRYSLPYTRSKAAAEAGIVSRHDVGYVRRKIAWELLKAGCFRVVPAVYLCPPYVAGVVERVREVARAMLGPAGAPPGMLELRLERVYLEPATLARMAERAVAEAEAEIAVLEARVMEKLGEGVSPGTSLMRLAALRENLERLRGLLYELRGFQGQGAGKGDWGRLVEVLAVRFSLPSPDSRAVAPLKTGPLAQAVVVQAINRAKITAVKGLLMAGCFRWAPGLYLCPPQAKPDVGRAWELAKVPLGLVGLAELAKLRVDRFYLEPEALARMAERAAAEAEAKIAAVEASLKPLRRKSSFRKRSSYLSALRKNVEHLRGLVDALRGEGLGLNDTLNYS